MNDFIIGPQLPLTNSWFDQTQIAKAKEHGQAFPADPPTDHVLLDGVYTLSNYYDLALSEYIAYARTGDPVFLSYGRKVADSWWKHPTWINSGQSRLWITEGSASPSPKFAGVGGLILRALDGRPEMWGWINDYTRSALDLWLKRRINDPQLYYGVREGAFALHFAAWLAKVLPDSFPLQAGGIETNGTGLRAQYLTDVEAISIQYFGRLQHADGSWRWDDWDFIDSDGGQLRGVMQPFMVGMLTAALVDVHQLTTNTEVKESVKNQILKACRHLYSDGPYIKDQIEVNSGKKIRGFHYFYHGGTTVNPTKYEKGDIVFPWTALEAWWLSGLRQLIGTSLPAYAYAFKISGDPYFKSAYEEMFDSAYNGTDGERAMLDGTAKNYNQHIRRVSASLAWLGGTVAPLPQPQPTPTPSPTPTPTPVPSPTPTPIPSPTSQTPSPDNTKSTSIVDSQGALWTLGPEKQTLRNSTQVGGGLGSIYKYSSSVVYVLGMDSNWYKWNGTWVVHGTTEPGAVPAPVPSPAPTPAPAPAPAPVPSPIEKPVGTIEIFAYPATESKTKPVLDDMWAKGWRLYDENVRGEKAKFKRER